MNRAQTALCGSAWSEELLKRCFAAEVRIWVSGEIYYGRIDSIRRGSLRNDPVLLLGLVEVTREQIHPSTKECIKDCEWVIAEPKTPVTIKEDGYDCVWAFFSLGYFAIYFTSSPKEG